MRNRPHDNTSNRHNDLGTDLATRGGADVSGRLGHRLVGGHLEDFRPAKETTCMNAKIA